MKKYFNTDSAKAAYLKQHEKSILRVRNRVRVTRIAEDYELGWDYPWVAEMDSTVGKIGTVLRNDDVLGFQIKFPDMSRSYWYPFFVLKKVRQAPRKPAKKKVSR